MQKNNKVILDDIENFRNIQSRIEAIRNSLDVIEGNLIDYIDSTATSFSNE